MKNYGNVLAIGGVSLLAYLLLTRKASASPISPPHNVCVNGGFETGDLTGWMVEGDTTVHKNEERWVEESFYGNTTHIIHNPVHSGEYACRLYGKGQSAHVSQSMTCPGTLTFWYYPKVGSRGGLEVWVDNNREWGVTNDTWIIHKLYGKWNKVNIDLPSYTGDHVVSFRMYPFHTYEEEVWLDDISLMTA